MPVATSADGCASGDCLPEAADDENSTPRGVSLPLGERWAKAVDVVAQTTPRHAKSLSFGRLISLNAGEARLAFPTDAGFHRATVFGSGRAEIEGLLSRQLGERVRLVEEKSESAFAAAPRSVAETTADARATREKGLESKIRSNPAVLSVLRVLGGNLEHVQILEPSGPAETEAQVAPDDDA